MNNKLLIGIVAISLALNLALIGFVIGNAARPFPSFDPTRGYAHWLHSLPSDRQEVLRPILRQNFHRVPPLRLRKLHSEFRTLLVNEPLDQQALLDALARIRAGHEQRQSASHQAFVQLVSAMTQAERQALADELGQKRRRSYHRDSDFRP